MLDFIKKLSIRANTEHTAGAAATADDAGDGNRPSLAALNPRDALDTRLMSIVQEVIESRESLSHKLEEKENEVAARDLKISELKQEIGFLENKIENQSKEILKTQEIIQDLKLQHEQLAGEYAAYRTQQEKKALDLQERLKERELTNRQLIVDLNRTQKEKETKILELETRERELLVKQQHLEDKYRQALLENERLVATINQFASQATKLTKHDHAAAKG